MNSLSANKNAAVKILTVLLMLKKQKAKKDEQPRPHQKPGVNPDAREG
jgi:hypothetical protein